MVETVQLTVQISEEDRRQADQLFADLGMTLDEAVAIFIKQCLMRDGLPFRVRRTAPKPASAKLSYSEVPSETEEHAVVGMGELSPNETTFADIDQLIQKLGIDIESPISGER